MLRILLYPIAFLFEKITSIRNYLYERKFFKSTKFEFPVICIGNLSTGGTGKTPHTDYLINLIKPEYNVGVLSRGYKRKTNGFLEVETSSLAQNVGDEPLFYKWKHPETKVAVCEDRVFGLASMAQNEDKEYVYLLDDAFQHRAVKAGLYILITEYNQLYVNDFVIPLGNLRENPTQAKRADIIIVSKCPPSLSFDEKNRIKALLKPEKYQHIFFSSMAYQRIYSIFNHDTINLESKTTVLLVTGIAKPEHLENELDSRFQNVYSRHFNDHHNFSTSEVESIIRTFNGLEETNKILLTTEKDITRLFQYKNLFINAKINVFCIPINVKFDKTEKEAFDKAIKHYLSITLPLPIVEENELLL